MAFVTCYLYETIPCIFHAVVLDDDDANYREKQRDLCYCITPCNDQMVSFHLLFVFYLLVFFFWWLIRTYNAHQKSRKAFEEHHSAYASPSDLQNVWQEYPLDRLERLRTKDEFNRAVQWVRLSKHLRRSSKKWLTPENIDLLLAHVKPEKLAEMRFEDAIIALKIIQRNSFRKEMLL